MIMTSLILIPVLFGIILYKVPLKIGKVLLLLVQCYLSLTGIFLLLKSKSGEIMYEILGGEDPILFIGLRGDRIALVLVCLVVFLFTMAFIYSLKDKYFDNKFLLLFLVLQGLMIGIFLTDDLFNIFVLLEVSTIVITILIMLITDNRSIYDGLFYLIIQIISMMFFLFGIAYIYKIFGVLSLEEITNLLTDEVASDTFILPFAFLMTGVCLKIGFFPLFSWVARSYGTPSTPFPVVAILSGLFVKCSLTLFIRLNSIFYPLLDFTEFFLIVGILSGVLGVIKALSQKNIKLILAYSTISQVGLIAVSSFIPGDIAYWGGMYHLINHAIFKTLLFLVSGIIAEEYKTTHISKIRGVFNRMPVVGVVALVAILGITGAPFFNGSVSKYWILAGSKQTMIETVLWIINIGTILTYVKYGSILFGKSEVKASTDPLKTSVIMILGLICFLGGVYGKQIVHFLFDVELSIATFDYLIKGVYYIFILWGSFIFYRLVFLKYKVLDHFGERSLSLPQSCFILLVFFTSIVVYGTFLA